MKKIFLSCFLTIIGMTMLFVTGTGYFIGNYAVHFGLQRGTIEHPQDPPRAYALLMPPEARVFSQPDYPAEDWSLPSFDGLTLAATHFSPHIPGNHKWAIIIHGYGCTQQNSWYIAEHYLQQGYDVVTPDLRGAGKSEGRFLTLGYLESRDIVDWAKQIAARDPDARIVMHGVSMGAATVMIASASDELPSQLVAAVEDCGYTGAYDLLTYQIRDSFGLPVFPAMPLMNWRCRAVAGFDLDDANPLLAVEHAKVPILFIHGEKDVLVPPEMADRLYESCRAPRKQLLYIPGAVHAAASQKDTDLYFNTVFGFVRPYVTQKNR